MTPIFVFQFVSSFSLRSRVSHASPKRLQVWSIGILKDLQLRNWQQEDEDVENNVHSGADPCLCCHVDTFAVHAPIPAGPHVAEWLAVTQQRHNEDEAEARDECQQSETHMPEALLGEDPEIEADNRDLGERGLDNVCELGDVEEL